MLAEHVALQVYQGILNQSVPVAIKCISDEKQYVKRRFVEEIVCVMNLRHANVCTCARFIVLSVPQLRDRGQCAAPARI